MAGRTFLSLCVYTGLSHLSCSFVVVVVVVFFKQRVNCQKHDRDCYAVVLCFSNFRNEFV